MNPLKLLRNKLLKDTATLQISGMLTVASSFVSSALIAFLLGSHGQGLFAVAVSMQALFYSLANVGLISATVSQVAAASSRDLRDKVTAWLAFLVKTYVLFSALLIAVGWFTLPWLAETWYTHELGAEAAHELGLWAWWLTWWILLDTPRAMTQVAFQSSRRMLALAQLDNGFELMRMFLTILGACITGSPAGAVIGEVTSRVLGTYLALHLYHRAEKDGGPWLPGWKAILSLAPRIPVREGLRLAVRVGVIKGATNLAITVLPRLLLAGTASFSWVAYFHLASRIMILPQMLMQGVSRTILPALAEQRGRKDLAGFRRLYWRASLISGAAISVVIILGVLLVEPVVRRAFPADYAWPVFVCCAILSVGMVPSAFAVAQDPFYMLTNRMKQNLAICLIGALITIPVNVLLVQVDPDTGPVWGQSLYLSWVLVHFAYIAYYFKQHAHKADWED